MLENRNISHRFRAFAHHPYCDWFLQAVGNYIEAYLSRSRLEVAIVTKEKIQWGALGRKPLFDTLSPAKLAAASVSDTVKEEALCGSLVEETGESLKQLSTIYMRVMLDFSDFDKVEEDYLFFEQLNSFCMTVLRLHYGMKAQKQAEIELTRVFSDMFNSAARKYQFDPHVQARAISMLVPSHSNALFKLFQCC